MNRRELIAGIPCVALATVVATPIMPAVVAARTVSVKTVAPPHSSFFTIPEWYPWGLPWRVQHDRYGWGTTLGEPFEDGDLNGCWHIAVKFDSGEHYSMYPGHLYWENYHGR